MSTTSPFSPDYVRQYKHDKREPKPIKAIKQPPKYGRKSIAEAASERPHYWMKQTRI